MKKTIIEAFGSIYDPRREHKKLYSLIEIIFLTISAVVSGADHFTEIQQFGDNNLDWLRKFLPYKNGIPSHDCLGYFFTQINPKEFKRCFAEWVKSMAKVTNGEIVAIDGKTLRRSYDSTNKKTAVHMVSAWANSANLVLAQVKTEEKSNEITAIPELLKILELNGCIVTIDAMGTQREIAKSIINAKADYVLALKGNQGTLHDDVIQFFEDALLKGFHEYAYETRTETNKDHGRYEVREYFLVTDISWLPQVAAWKGLSSVGMVKASITENGNTTVMLRYYISSLTNNCGQFAHAVRFHWGIENSLHWCLDIGFREDESRVRNGDAPDNFAVIRHICLNLLKQEKTRKAGLKGKRLNAAWNSTYREKVLFGV